MRVEPYDRARHRAGCLAAFDGNVAGPDRPGGAFRPEERGAFEAFLDHLPGPYRVVVDASGVVACGGWAAEADPGLLSLCWVLVAPGRQGHGIGRHLVRGLLEAARTEEGGRRSGGDLRMRLETVPATRGFFEAVGFRVVSVQPGGYGPGAPAKVEMALLL